MLLVVLIQKDNCAFRSFSATHLSVIRQGCLFAFMCLFCVLSAVSSPFLDIPSNSSDLVSRFGYVILAMLGLLAAVKIPYTDPATIAVNVVIYGFSCARIVFLWCSDTHLPASRLQRLLHRDQQELRPALGQAGAEKAGLLHRHLLSSPRPEQAYRSASLAGDGRRAVRPASASEAVSSRADLRKPPFCNADSVLCSPIYAMPPKRKLVFTEDPQLPPYLLAFGGSVAERFVGDLQVRYADPGVFGSETD